MRRHLSLLPKILVVLMAIGCLSIFIATLVLLVVDRDSFESIADWTPLGYIVPAILLIRYINRPPRFTILVITVCIPLLELSDIISTMMTVPSMGILLFLNVVMVASGIHCFIGDDHSATRLIYISITIIALNLAAGFMIFLIAILSLDSRLILMAVYNLSSVFMYILFTLFLSQRDVREERMGSKLKGGIEATEALLSSGPGAFIYREEVYPLLGMDMSGWYYTGPSCPIEALYTATIHDGRRSILLTSKKWRGENCIRINVDEDLKTRPYGTGFLLTYHSFEQAEEGLYLRLYGEDGFFMRVRIKDMPKVQPRFFQATDLDIYEWEEQLQEEYPQND